METQSSSLRVSQVSISAIELLLWQTIYYGTERLLRLLHRSKFPQIHKKLLLTRRDLPFFGVGMGFLITFFSWPFCLSAFLQGLPSVETPIVSASSKICIVSRSVLWISELSRLGDNTFYLAHHLFSIACLWHFIYNQLPLTSLHFFLSSLVSELASDTLYLLKAHGLTSASSWWTRTAERSTLLMQVFVKLPPLWFGIYWLVTAGSRIMSLGEICGSSLLLVAYAGFQSFSIVKLAHNMRLISVQYSQDPAHIRFGEHICTLYGLYMGLGLASLSSVSVILYMLSAELHTSLHGGEIISHIASIMPRVIAASILGARIFSILFEDGILNVVKSPRESVFRPGFWLHGGIVGAGVAIWYYTDLISDPGLLISCMGVSLPLFEFFSRLGCASYGCCFGRAMEEVQRGPSSPPPPSTSTPPLPFLMRFLRLKPVVYTSPDSAVLRQQPSLSGIPLFPVQKASAILYLLHFFINIAILILFTRKGTVLVVNMGRISFALHALIRLATEGYRADFRGSLTGAGTGWTVTGVIALVQMVTAVVMVLRSRDMYGDGGLRWEQVMWEDVCRCGVVVFLFSTGVYGYAYQRIGRWVKANTSQQQAKK